MNEQYQTADGVASEEFYKAYARLRTVTDSLEATTLRYCFESKDAAESIQRADKVEKLLMSVLEQIPDALPNIEAEGGCGEGYYNCGGVCVPYPCPFSKFRLE